MDPTKILEADHRHVEDLFAKIERAEGDARSPLIEDLLTSLARHMELEESVLYPAMQAVTGAEAVKEAVTEHDLARKILKDVGSLAPDEPGFGAALASAQAGIAHHVEEEEGEVFPQLRKDGADLLAGIATDFMRKRVELGLPFDAAALAAASTKDELLEEAQSAHIEGASSMTKPELADALVQQMS